MERTGGFYLIALGERADEDEFPGPLYLEEHEGGEFVLPVFFSPETLERYAKGMADFPRPESRTAAELEAGRYRVVRLKGEVELFELAAWAGADCLVWDPDPRAATHRVYRLPE